MTTPVFDRPLFSPDVIILFENLHRDRPFQIPLDLVVTGINTE